MKSKNLKSVVEAFSGIRVGVIGDLMLDQYIWGSTERISQEAPVPVVLVRKQSHVPGGAANVARNVLSLGGEATLFGLVGKDREGEWLQDKLQEAKVDVAGVVQDEVRPTTVKTRVLANNQQVVRIDQEDTREVMAAQRLILKKRIEQRIRQGDLRALIIEDYAKGVLGKKFMQQVVEIATRHGVKTMLDPHPKNNFNVKGLTLMTPNRNEAFMLAGVKYVPGIGAPVHDKPLNDVAKILMRLWNPRYLLITLGAEGMALFEQERKEPWHIPTRARQVFDVSGAGDTVMATMVMALLSGADVIDAARIANAAAGVVVGLIGTAAIQKEALLQALDAEK